MQLTGDFAGFARDAQLLFGGVPAAGIEWHPDGSLSAVVPPAAEPGISVPVVLDDGTQAKTAAQAFTFTPRLSAPAAVAYAGDLETCLRFDPPATLRLLAGRPALAPTATPGVDWHSELASPFPVFEARAPLQHELCLTTRAAGLVPAVGLTIALQALVSPTPSASALAPTFSNRVLVSVE